MSLEQEFDLDDLDDINNSVAEHVMAVEQAAKELMPQEPEPVQQLQIEHAEVPVTEHAVRTFSIYKDKCLSCKQLVGALGKKAHTSCHFSNGNDACPAAEFQIKVALPYDRISDQLLDAHIRRDAACFADLMARLNRHDADEIDQVMKAYETKLANYLTK